MTSTRFQHARRLIISCYAAGALMAIGFVIADARMEPYAGLVLVPLAIVSVALLAIGLGAGSVLAAWALVRDPTARRPGNIALATVGGMSAVLLAAYALALRFT
jgi:hypothetical protein